MPSLRSLLHAAGPSRAALAARCGLCLLALVLLLQGSAALFAATLGPRHGHVEPLPQTTLLDSRRGVVMTTLALAQPARAGADKLLHGQMHRHHHAAGVPGVEYDDAAQRADAQSAAAAWLAVWFPAAAPPPAWGGVSALRDARPAGAGWFVASADTPTPEKPPRAPRHL